MATPPLSQERLAEIANQSFVTEANQKAFGVDKKADVVQTNYKSGITTSDSAANRSKAANETLASITSSSSSSSKESPLEALYKRLNTLQSDLAKAKEAEKKAKEDQANADIQTKLKGLSSAEEVGDSAKADMTAGTEAIFNGGTIEGIEDPTIKALAEKTSANISVITNQMQTLDQYRKQFNEYTQQDIDSIARTAERSVQRQIEENTRVTNAMRFAGVLAGRAQFAPVTEQSIIHEVIQDGLDKIEVINEKKNTAIREARKAEAEFNVDVFEQQAELAKEYNNEIEATISAMNAQVRQVEQDERDRMTFRQTQEERNSILLAEQLIDATPDKILQAAAMNGIDAGLLMKAVNDARFERTDRNLTLEGKRADIANAWKSYNSGKEVVSDIPKDVEQGFRSVARLSKEDAEAAWEDVKNFGLEESVSLWLEGGLSKAQVKSMVSAHEQSQRGIKDGDEGAMKPTDTETTLFSVIDNWKSEANKKAEEDLTNLITGQSFFKKN